MNEVATLVLERLKHICYQDSELDVDDRHNIEA